MGGRKIWISLITESNLIIRKSMLLLAASTWLELQFQHQEEEGVGTPGGSRE
jgi:hypothetical protein